jgi:hypothetical protein
VSDGWRAGDRQRRHAGRVSPGSLTPTAEPVADKCRAFGWDTREVDGNDMAAVVGALAASRARELAYRLYVIAEPKKRAAEALSYNALVQSWPESTRVAREGAPARDLFEAAGG